MFVKLRQIFQKFYSFVKIMSRDFSKIKKSGCGTVSKQKRTFAQNFRKIVGRIKVIVKVGEKVLLKL